MAGDPKEDLTNEAPSRATEPSAGPPATLRSATLGRSTPEKGEALLFKNSNEELEYLWREDACL
jgi:hypothetical protein